jgi:hypothetical protein
MPQLWQHAKLRLRQLSHYPNRPNIFASIHVLFKVAAYFNIWVLLGLAESERMRMILNYYIYLFILKNMIDLKNYNGPGNPLSTLDGPKLPMRGPSSFDVVVDR